MSCVGKSLVPKKLFSYVYKKVYICLLKGFYHCILEKHGNFILLNICCCNLCLSVYHLRWSKVL